MYCGKCGNEIQEGEKFCGKCGMEISKGINLKCIELKKKQVLIITLAIIVIISIGIIANNNQKEKTLIENLNSSTTKTSNDKETETLNLDSIKLKTWYRANETGVDKATLKLYELVWEGIIKEYYPNAVLNKFTIHDKDNYGRYIVGIAFCKSSQSEELTYNWCCTAVKDINDESKIGYWKLNPTDVRFIYNDSTYGWGTPLPDNMWQ